VLLVSDFDLGKLSLTSDLWIIHGILCCSLDFGGNFEQLWQFLNATYNKVILLCGRPDNLQFHSCKSQYLCVA